MSFGRRTGLPDVDAMTPIVLTVSGRVTRSAVPALCAELEALLTTADRGVTSVDCDVGGLVRPDLAAVEAVARLSLVARRSGDRRLRLRRTPPELQLLLDLVGLEAVVGLADPAAGQETGEQTGPKGRRVPE
ncbi:STAS domain-containing protein [Streptomyces sp. NPDC091265]|uniref:STAS domain-containing protein n=1 Tax=unclassified Streptomyces TaxID=2593676 RepID=UPI00344FC210